MRPFWLYGGVENRPDKMHRAATSHREGLVEKTELDSSHGCTVREQEATGDTQEHGKPWLDKLFSFFYHEGGQTLEEGTGEAVGSLIGDHRIILVGKALEAPPVQP